MSAEYLPHDPDLKPAVVAPVERWVRAPVEADEMAEVRRLLADMNASNWCRLRDRLLELCGCDD